MAERGLIEHVEQYLGPIAEGWGSDASGARLPFVIARFDGQPADGLTTYLTLGLSEHVLRQTSGETRQELLFAVNDRDASSKVAGLLTAVGEIMIERHAGLLRGDVLPPAGPLMPGATLEAMYAASPVVYPDGFAVFERSEPPTVFVWLIPIDAEEAELIDSHGWSWFEDQLEAQQPDLFDLRRPRIAH